MLVPIRKSDHLLSLFNGSLIDLPSPSSLTYFWNLGSLLGAFLGVQIVSGLFLAMQFSGDVYLSFDSIIHIMRDVNSGWLLRVMHANGASFFFLLMFIHVGRGLYYGSYRFIKTWLSGVTILLLSMATAFLGYVLPWGQMSFWAATVITNLLSATPYVGVLLVEWVWGGFSVGNPTLTRFFSFHFILPFIILFMVILHLVFLHETGSSNPLGMNSDLDKIMFHPYFSLSDIYGFMILFMLYFSVCYLSPYIFMDTENFMTSNPMVTPTHIQPEWYFLFAYTILRSISSKIGGVIALFMSVLMYYFLPFFFSFRFRSIQFYNFIQYIYWYFLANWLMLTWIGACEVDYPYMQLGAMFSFIYFLMILLMGAGVILEDNMI
uniref:Cytochrome b n=1 Tax=Tetragnatha moua TaxID=545213 RepID=A0A2I6BYR7_9ARAC|nr:cytochrome b [Tetragnatha moua]